MTMTLMFKGIDEFSSDAPEEDMRTVALAFELLEQSLPFITGLGTIKIIVEKRDGMVVVRRDPDGKIRARIE
ncbi:MAG: hypothetical protein ACP6IU_13345 [Candidatus Asgardarchaeia archaeon]